MKDAISDFKQNPSVSKGKNTYPQPFVDNGVNSKRITDTHNEQLLQMQNHLRSCAHLSTIRPHNFFAAYPGVFNTSSH